MATRVAVAVVAHAGCVLAGRRPEGVPLEGLWEFPGGKLNPGETPERCAERECLEETGVPVVVERALAHVKHQYEHGSLTLTFFLCRPTHPHAPPRLPFRWVPRSELGELEFPQANQAVLDLLAAGSVGDSGLPKKVSGTVSFHRFSPG